MAKQPGDALKFYHAAQRGMRSHAGKALPPLVKRWRYTQSSDFAELELKPAATRFLTRYGLLDSGNEDAVQNEKYRDLLTRIARESGDAPGIAAAWINLFAEGEYGVVQSGICADEPRCAVCTLKEGCRYLAAGGKDARSFGESLASDLLRASEHQPVDHRISELLAFAACGERCGAADFAQAEAALKECNGLRGVFQARPAKLRELGYRDTAVARLQAVAELCRNWAGEKLERGRTFTCGRDFYDHFHLRLRDLKKEILIVVLLDQKHGLIAEEHVSEGSLTETLVHPREVFAQAIARHAAAVALIHNHPSGDPAPSAADKAITKRLETVSKLIGIRLLDHVIIGDGRFTSFVEAGLMGG